MASNSIQQKDDGSTPNKHSRLSAANTVLSNQSNQHKIDHNLYQVSRLVTLSGTIAIHDALTGMILINWSFCEGVIAAYKGAHSCFNPKLFYLSETISFDKKCDILTTYMSPHLQGLSMSRVSSKVLKTIGQSFNNLTELHLYTIADPVSKSKQSNQHKDRIVSKTDKNLQKRSKTTQNTNSTQDVPNTAENLSLTLEKLPNLEKLTIYRAPYCSQLVTSLSKLPNLKELDLNNLITEHPSDECEEQSDDIYFIPSTDVDRSNFTEKDWITISQNCTKLERLELNHIFGLTEMSLKELKANCSNLCYFDIISCDENYDYDGNSNTVWRLVTNIFGSQLKGLSLWNESNMNIRQMSEICPNLERLCLQGVWATSMTEFSLFKHLTKLELIGQRYVCNLEEIAYECHSLEEFSYTNEFPGKHSYSHDLAPFLDACNKLKKFFTNDETCSLQMAKMIVFNNDNLEVCCAHNKINIFSERYKEVLGEWSETCQCGGGGDGGDSNESSCDEGENSAASLHDWWGGSSVCSEKKTYKSMKTILDSLEFDKDGKIQSVGLYIPDDILKGLMLKAATVFKKFGIDKYNLRMESLLDESTINDEFDMLDEFLNVIIDFEEDFPKIAENMDNKSKECSNGDSNIDKENSMKWFGELQRIRAEIDSNFIPTPTLSKALANTVDALKSMRNFDNPKFNEQIDSLLPRKDDMDLKNVKLGEACKLFFSFQKEYGKDGVWDKMDDKQKEWYCMFVETSNYVFEWIYLCMKVTRANKNKEEDLENDTMYCR